MNVFTEDELSYLKGLHVARIATVSRNGFPHVVPIGFRVSEDNSAIEVGGWGFASSKKFRDLQVDPRVAIVVDDMGDGTPRRPRGIEIRGRAEIHQTGGDRFGAGRDPQWVEIRPERVSTWGIVRSAFEAGGQTSRAVSGS